MRESRTCAQLSWKRGSRLSVYTEKLRRVSLQGVHRLHGVRASFFYKKKVSEASSSAKKGPNSFENLNDAVNQHNRGLDSTVQC